MTTPPLPADRSGVAEVKAEEKEKEEAGRWDATVRPANEELYHPNMWIAHYEGAEWRGRCGRRPLHICSLYYRLLSSLIPTPPPPPFLLFSPLTFFNQRLWRCLELLAHSTACQKGTCMSSYWIVRKLFKLIIEVCFTSPSPPPFVHICFSTSFSLVECKLTVG